MTVAPAPGVRANEKREDQDVATAAVDAGAPGMVALLAVLSRPNDRRATMEAVRALGGVPSGDAGPALATGASTLGGLPIDHHPTVFRWFRRLAILADWSIVHIDGDVVGRAMEAMASVDAGTLARLLSGVDTNHPVRVEAVIFVAAALLATRRQELLRQAVADATPLAVRNLRKVAHVMNGARDAANGGDAYTISVVQHYLSVLFERAGNMRLHGAAVRRTADIDRAFRHRFNPPHTRILSHKWTFTIGHMVLVAYLIRGMDAGLFDFRRLQLWDGHTPNDALREVLVGLSDAVEMVPTGTMFAEIFAPAALESVDGRQVDIFELCGIVADRVGDAWGAIVPRPAADDPAVAGFLRASGIDPARRMVTLHAREDGHRRDVHASLRSVDVTRYLPAIRWLIAQGFCVVRVGDPSMSPLPEIDGLIDYARSPLKSHALDILLPGSAVFHIGCSSGLSQVPLLYGTPCLFLNWYPSYLISWGRMNWTVMKPMASFDGVRVSDWATYDDLSWLNSRGKLRQRGVDIADLEAEEVLDAVRAFVGGLDAPAPAAVGQNIGRVSLAGPEGFTDVPRDALSSERRHQHYA